MAARKKAAAAPAARLASRRYGRTGRGYSIDGQKVAGVTTILNALPKSLAQWASDAAANFAVENWDELSQETITKRIDRIRYAHRDVVSKAAARGTEIHKYGEKLVAGEEVSVADDLRTIVERYARFLDAWQIEPIAVEAPIGNASRSYAGTGDLWCEIGVRDNARAYVDLKTGKSVYESAMLQATAYDHAELWQPDGKESEEAYEPVDLVYVCHITPDDVQMLPVRGAGGAVKPGAADFRSFLYVQQVSQWLDRHGFKGDQPLIDAAAKPGELEEVGA